MNDCSKRKSGIGIFGGRCIGKDMNYDLGVFGDT